MHTAGIITIVLLASATSFVIGMAVAAQLVHAGVDRHDIAGAAGLLSLAIALVMVLLGRELWTRRP